MKVLAVELSSARGSIAFLNSEDECFACEFPNDQKHSGEFFLGLQTCLHACGHPERIVVGLGPGSYAGTRIAIAAATGLRVVTGAELVGLPSLCALPNESPEYCVVGDARRDSFFFAHVRGRRCVEGPLLLSQSELDARLRVSTLPTFAAERLVNFSAVQLDHPSASVLARIVPPPASRGVPLQPLYLRDPHITQPRSILV